MEVSLWPPERVCASFSLVWCRIVLLTRHVDPKSPTPSVPNASCDGKPAKLRVLALTPESRRNLPQTLQQAPDP